MFHKDDGCGAKGSGPSLSRSAELSTCSNIPSGISSTWARRLLIREASASWYMLPILQHRTYIYLYGNMKCRYFSLAIDDMSVRCQRCLFRYFKILQCHAPRASIAYFSKLRERGSPARGISRTDDSRVRARCASRPFSTPGLSRASHPALPFSPHSGLHSEAIS